MNGGPWPHVLAVDDDGMSTVEYAIGIALIIAIIGAMVLATHQGFFTQLVQDLFKALFATVIKGMGLG